MTAKLPFLARALNLLGKPLNTLSRRQLDLMSLEAKARRGAVGSDFGDGGYKAGATAFLESMRSNSRLHFTGSKLVQDIVAERLRTRLKIRETLSTDRKLREYVGSHEIANMARPVFVVGTPRSGTTYLYNLLALDENARGPKFWEVVDPAPPASTLSETDLTRRIEYYEKRLKRLKNLIPTGWDQIHAFTTATEIEEDFYLLEATFRCPSFALVYGNASLYRDYLYALDDDDILAAYREFAEMILLLMFPHDGDSGRYWLSKSPAHAPFSWAIARVFPHCTIIHTHRNPAERIPSLCSLVSLSEMLICNKSTPHEIAERVLDYNQLSINGIDRARAEAMESTATVIDVEYEKLRSRPIETVAEIHQQIGLEPSDGFETSARTWIETKNTWDPKRRGAHRYRAEDFGLNVETLENMEP